MWVGAWRDRLKLDLVTRSVLQMYVSDDFHAIKKLHVRTFFYIYLRARLYISRCSQWCWRWCIRPAIHRAHCTRVVNLKVDQDGLKNKDTCEVCRCASSKSGDPSASTGVLCQCPSAMGFSTGVWMPPELLGHMGPSLGGCHLKVEWSLDIIRDDSCFVVRYFSLCLSRLSGSPGWTETWKQLMLLTSSLHIHILIIGVEPKWPVVAIIIRWFSWLLIRICWRWMELPCSPSLRGTVIVHRAYKRWGVSALCKFFQLHKWADISILYSVRKKPQSM